MSPVSCALLSRTFHRPLASSACAPPPRSQPRAAASGPLGGGRASCRPCAQAWLQPRAGAAGTGTPCEDSSAPGRRLCPGAVRWPTRHQAAGPPRGLGPRHLPRLGGAPAQRTRHSRCLCVPAAGMNALQLQNLATLAAAAAAAQTSATSTNANPLSTTSSALGALTSPGKRTGGPGRARACPRAGGQQRVSRVCVKDPALGACPSDFPRPKPQACPAGARPAGRPPALSLRRREAPISRPCGLLPPFCWRLKGSLSIRKALAAPPCPLAPAPAPA